MDAIAFLLGIIIIVGTAGGVGIYSINLYHQRRTTELRIEEHASQAKFVLMEKAMEMKMLPAGKFLDNL